MRPLKFQLNDIQALAWRLGLTTNELARLSTLPRPYHCYEVPKRSGQGTRRICDPAKELKTLQRRLLDRVLQHLPVFRCVHGAMRKRDYVTHAQAHAKAECAFTLDIKDAFGSTTAEQVRLGLKRPEFSDDVIEAMVQIVMHDGSLPQGAPTSSAVWSAVCRNLDYALLTLAEDHGLVYTRYVDELTFSSRALEISSEVRGLILELVRLEGFVVNERKTRYQKRAQGDLQITGIAIGRSLRRRHPDEPRLHLPKRTVENLRAFLHQALGDASVSRSEVEGRLGALRHLSGTPRICGRANALPKRVRTPYIHLYTARGWK